MSEKEIKIVFERIRLIHYPIVMYHLQRRHKIYAFDFTYDMKKCTWLRRLINAEKIIRIYIKPHTKEHGGAIDQTEVIYSNLKNKRLQRIIANLYKSNEIDLIFKKSLLEEIFKYIYINNYLNAEGAKEGLRKILFYPDYYRFYEKMIAEHSNYKINALKNIDFCKWILPLLPIIRASDKLRFFGKTFFHLLLKVTLIITGRLIHAVPPRISHFKYAVPIDQVFQIKFKGGRNFDFILDHKKINIENTIFILNIPVNDEWLTSYKKKGYNFLRGQGIYKYIVSNVSTNPISDVFFALLGIAIRFNSSLLAFLSASIHSLNTFIEQQIIFNRVSFENYIYTNQESLRQLAINILVREQGGKTWDYAFSIGRGLIYAKDDDFSCYRHILWAFLNSDNYLAVHEDMVSYHRLHLPKVRKYHIIGNIYSGMVSKGSKEMKKDLILEHFKPNINSETKILVFFDTTFIDSEDAPTTFQDAICFYQDIITLLDEREDILVIIKPSKDEAFFVSPYSQWSSAKRGRDIIHLWNILRRNPKVYWAGDSGDTPSVMAASDLVITHCYSSSTVEALGARKKAIWYESGNKHRGTIYDNIPGLVIHGYANLKERIDSLLYKVNDEEYNNYLDQCIKGKVESSLDGLALTRFRQLLKK